jgi:hypothetical protein
MKTHIFKTRISTAILALLIIAFVAPQAVAQRSEQNKENTDKTTKQVEKDRTKDSNLHRDFNRPAKPGYDQSKVDKPDGNGHRENNRADNHDKNNHDNNGYRDKNRDDHKGGYHHDNNRANYNYSHSGYRSNHDFHFNFDLRPEHEYCWHRHQHISFRHLPRKAVWVQIDGENYAFYQNRFYLPGPFGFFRVTPPVYLHNLPDGCFRVMIDDRQGWNLHGILLVQTPFGFKIVV